MPARCPPTVPQLTELDAHFTTWLAPGAALTMSRLDSLSVVAIVVIVIDFTVPGWILW